MSTRTIRVDDEIFALIQRSRRPGESASDVVARLLKEAEQARSYMMMVDYEKVPTEYLVLRLAKAEARVAADPEDEGCGNMSDRLCCDVCGIPELQDEIARRQKVQAPS